MKWPRSGSALAFALVTAFLGASSAAPAASPAGTEVDAEAPDSGRRLELFPRGHLYAPYVADPHAPGAAIEVHAYSSTGVEQASDLRYHLELGGRFGLVRRRPRAPGGRAWQLSLDAGLDAQFDIHNGLDNTGWDGNYGVSLTTSRGRAEGKLGLFHTSSHLGDEWIVRTGRERINYTREEILVGFGFRPRGHLRLYVEGGWAYLMRNQELMDPLRLQAGAEWERPGVLWGGLAGWFAAVDLAWWEERGSLDTAASFGVAVPSGGRTWRMGLTVVDGRPPLGEFFQADETSVALVLTTDL